MNEIQLIGYGALVFFVSLAVAYFVHKESDRFGRKVVNEVCFAGMNAGVMLVIFGLVVTAINV